MPPRQELRAIKAPACLIAGNDVIHTPATARKAASLIPNSELHDDVVEKRADNDLRKEWDRKEWRDAEPRIAAIFAAFLETNAESKYSQSSDSTRKEAMSLANSPRRHRAYCRRPRQSRDRRDRQERDLKPVWRVVLRGLVDQGLSGRQ